MLRSSVTRVNSLTVVVSQPHSQGRSLTHLHVSSQPSSVSSSPVTLQSPLQAKPSGPLSMSVVHSSNYDGVGEVVVSLNLFHYLLAIAPPSDNTSSFCTSTSFRANPLPRDLPLPSFPKSTRALTPSRKTTLTTIPTSSAHEMVSTPTSPISTRLSVRSPYLKTRHYPMDASLTLPCGTSSSMEFPSLLIPSSRERSTTSTTSPLTPLPMIYMFPKMVNPSPSRRSDILIGPPLIPAWPNTFTLPGGTRWSGSAPSTSYTPAFTLSRESRLDLSRSKVARLRPQILHRILALQMSISLVRLSGR